MLTRRHFLMATPLLTLAGCSRKSAEDPFWAGHVGPLSGPDRRAGEHFQRGLVLALEEVNAEDVRVAGRRLAVIHADSRGLADRARHETVRLVSLNKLVALLGGRDLATVDRLSQALQPYPVPLLTAAPHSPASVENVFSVDVAPDFRGVCLARFGEKHLKARKAAIVADNQSLACATAASAFARHWRSGEGRTVQTWDIDSKDGAKELPERLRKAEADVLLFAGKAADLLSVRAALPGTMQVLFGGEPAEWERLEATSDAGKNLHGATVHAGGDFDEDGKDFLKNYRKAHNEEADGSACQGYELTRLLASVLRRVKGAGPVKVREELSNGEDFPTLTGKLNFSRGHAVRPLYVMLPRQSTPVEKYQPD